MKEIKAVTLAVNEYDLDQMQYDALWDLLSDNPLLPSSSIASRNKALKTTKQNVIGAINELLDMINKNKDNVTSFDNLLNQALGSIAGDDSDTWQELQTIDTNVIKAIVRIWHELGGAEEGLDISEIGSSIKEAITNLNSKVNNHEERIQQLERSIGDSIPPVDIAGTKVREVPQPLEGEPNKFVLTHKPNEKPVILVVNGIEYDENDEFIVDRLSKTITWTLREFDLDSNEDELDVNYYI